MTESDVWGRIRPLFKEYDPDSHVVRHEDRMSPGVPDVSFCVDGISGWVELKVADSLPRSLGDPVQFREPLKPEQKNWLEARGRAGAAASVLAVVKGSYYVIPWWYCRGLGTKYNLPLIQKRSYYRGDMKGPDLKLITALLECVKRIA